MEKKRIAMIVNSNIYSGLEKVATEIMTDLSSEYEFIYVTKNGPVVDRIKEINLNYYLVDNISIKSIKAFIKDWQPDVIHAHDFTASTIVAICGFKNFISHLHNNPLWIKKICINSFAYLIFGIRAKHILIVSDSVKDEFIFRDCLKNKYMCIDNPLRVNEVREKAGENITKKYDICCVGRIEEQKNPLRFLHILKELKKDMPDLKACWIGDGSLRQECIDYVENNDLRENVFFLGYMKNPYEVMNQTKIFMLTSSWEGFGLVVFEALCLGLPCLVSNVGGLKNIVNDSCGYLCEKNFDFVNNARDILNDKDKYHCLSIAAIQRSKELDNRIDYMKQIAGIYNEILEKEK